MKKSLRFILATGWILLTRAYDAYATYQYTPDLSNEANPLVSVVGMSWGPLLLVLGLLTAYTIYVFYQAVFRPMDLYPSEPGYSFSHFAGFVYTGKKESWPVVFYKFPKSVRRFNQYMGQLLPRCLVFAGIVSTLMWIGLNYTEFYWEWHSAALIYSILAIGSLILIFQWLNKAYQTYQNRVPA